MLCLQDDHVISLILKLPVHSINVSRQSVIATILLQTLHQMGIGVTSLDRSGQQTKRDILTRSLPKGFQKQALLCI